MTTYPFVYDAGIDPVSASQSGGSGTPGGSQSQVQFNNSGAFSGDPALTFDSATKALVITPASGVGVNYVQRFVVGETGTADFGVVLGKYAGSYGETRQDNTFAFGYNVAPTGRQNTSEHLFSTTIESRYKTSAGIIQLEYYNTYQNAAGTTYYRPFSMTVNLTTDACVAALRTDQTVFGSKDTTNDWLSISSTPTTGSVALSGASSIDYAGSKADFVTAAGSAVLGYSAGHGRLFSGQVTADLFNAGGQIGSDTMTINVGGNNSTEQRGIRWNPAAGWQYQTATTTWLNFGYVQSYYLNGSAASPVGIGPTTFTPDGNSTLHVFGGNSGATKLYVQLGGAGTQNQNPIEVVSNDKGTTFFKVSLDGKAYSRSFRSLLDNSFALQADYDSAHPLLLNSSASIGFTNTANWYDTIDVAFKRNAAGVLEVNNGTAGTYCDILVRYTRTSPTTVASLIAAATAGMGSRSFVTDATATLAAGIGTTVAGGGSNKVPVYSDGTNWLIG